MRVLPVVVQCSLFAKSHITQFTGVGEHVGEVLRFHVVSHLGCTPVRELAAYVTEIQVIGLVFLHMAFQGFFGA